MLLSMLMVISRSQCTHFDSISTETYAFRNCPCTKGAARASSAQAPYNRSPVLKFSRCEVGSTVTG
jgi:hypothetical protein